MFRSLFSFVFHWDMAWGLLIALVVPYALGHEHSWALVAFSVVSAYAPDGDFIPFLVFRKWIPVPSHRVIGHHPIFWLGLGLAIMPWSPIGGVILALGTMCHFLHDSGEPQGLHWFSPFSWRMWRFGMAGFVEVSPEVRRARLKELERLDGWVEEIGHRTELVEPGVAYAVIFLAALNLVAIY